MTDKPTVHPKPGRADPLRLSDALSKTPPRRSFDPASLGRHGPKGPKGPKGKPMPLPGKSRGR
jgi:hypothetical protein